MRTHHLLSLMALFSFLTACGVQKSAAPMAQKARERAQRTPRQLVQNHFQRDRSAIISEGALSTVLQAPVFIEEGARLGILYVRNGYQVQRDLPLADVPGTLRHAIEKAGLFDATTEISADWPAHSGIPGLRELAARYRTEYVLLYRHRFVDHKRVNGLGWLYATVVGVFFVPGRTLQTDGELEATLFEVKSGTILFSAYERVSDSRLSNIWHNTHKKNRMKERLLTKAADKLAKKVIEHTRTLVALRARYQTPTAALSVEKQ